MLVITGLKFTIMYRKILYYTACLLMTMSFVSCESLFEKDPYDSTKKDEILTNEKDAQTLLYGMYAGFKSSASYGTSLTVMLDIMTDATLAAAGFTNQMGEMYSWRFNPGSSEIGSIWTNHYASIYNTNYLINNIDKIEGDEANLNRIKGEALTGRALLHYNLVRIYGKAYNSATAATDLGVPYVTSNEIETPSRHTVAEVYNNILSDLEDAELLLSENIYYENVVFTQDFVRGLLARVSLEMKNYDAAIVYANELIESKTYALEEGVRFINMWSQDAGTEIIWKVGYTPTDYGAAPGYNFYNRNNSANAPNPDYIPAEWWVNSYNIAKDVRYYAYLDYTKTGYGWEGHLINKYPTNPNYQSQGLNMPKPMRLAEMYLISAEANAELDQDAEARDKINALLSKRLLDFQGINISGDELKAFIAGERIKELMFEGFYWFDLKRMGKGFKRMPQANTSVSNDLEIAADDYRWQWPIPTAELNGNDNIEQNPGY